MAYTSIIMFGFSITKLLFTVFIILVVWRGFRWYTRLRKCRFGNNAKDGQANYGSSSTDTKTPQPNEASNTHELVRCVVCETFVSSLRAVSCGENNCPFPG